MPRVTVFTTTYCPYCHAARDLLAKKGISFTEIDVTRDASLRTRLLERTGSRTVPQIFVDDRPIGGYDDLAALESAGALDAILA